GPPRSCPRCRPWRGPPRGPPTSWSPAIAAWRTTSPTTPSGSCSSGACTRPSASSTRPGTRSSGAVPSAASTGASTGRSARCTSRSRSPPTPARPSAGISPSTRRTAGRPAARRVARRAAAVGGAGIRRRRPGEPMYRGLSVIAVVPVLNEEGKIGRVLGRMPRAVVDEMLVVDDGSTDRSPEIARQLGASVLPMGRVAGVGAALRAGYRYGVDHGYDVVVVLAGNDKDAPEEIPLLLDPIADDRADFVQGSRFLKPGASFGAMPFYRRIATRVHPLLFSLAAWRWVTESTNGFRAVHRRVLA